MVTLRGGYTCSGVFNVNQQRLKIEQEAEEPSKAEVRGHRDAIPSIRAALTILEALKMDVRPAVKVFRCLLSRMVTDPSKGPPGQGG